MARSQTTLAWSIARIALMVRISKISHVMCALKHTPKGRPSSDDKNVAALRRDERK